MAGGNLQIKNLDYDGVYAPFIDFSNVMLIQSTAIELGWKAKHLEYDQAFLNALLDRLINISFPHNLPPDMKKEMCYQLIKALYGLRQAPLCWFTTVRDCLLHKHKFTQLSVDGSIYVKKGPQGSLDDTVVV